MLKRNGTPSLSHRIGKIPHPKKKKNSKENNKLFLPLLKDNIEENNRIKQNLVPKMPSSKENRRNRLSIDCSKKNILSPIHTELSKNKKRGSRYEENSSKYLLNIKGKSTNQIIKLKVKNNENSKDKNMNNFNKNNIYPMKNDEKTDNKLNYKVHHKFKSDSLLDKEYIFQIKKDATYSKKGTEEGGKLKENNQDISIILNNVCNIENYNIYGIMDGHGSNGHLVSNFVKEKIEEYFRDKKIYKTKKL